MRQDPITIRFIEVFEWLKEEGRVRSARQFALSIDTYAQSFNDILKGRREATLQMIQRLTEVYNINSHYLLTGQGSIERTDFNGISTAPKVNITFLQAHQFCAYAGAIALNNSEDHPWSSWEIPVELVGQQIEMAIQCNTDRLASCISKGDILFARKVPREAWKSNLSSKRIYAITVQDNVHIIRIDDNDATGIFLKSDDRNLPEFISYNDIQEIWCPSSKWSHHVIMRDSEQEDQSHLKQINLTLKDQSESINRLQKTIQHLSQRKELHGQLSR